MSGTRRWRVAIVDDHERSRASLRAAIWAAGGDIAGEAVRAADADALVERTTPDVVVLAVGLRDGDGVEIAARLSPRHAVVLFTSHRDEPLLARARAAGVMGWLGKPLRAADLPPVLDLAVARFTEARELRQALEARKRPGPARRSAATCGHGSPHGSLRRDVALRSRGPRPMIVNVMRRRAGSDFGRTDEAEREEPHDRVDLPRRSARQAPALLRPVEPATVLRDVPLEQ